MWGQKFLQQKDSSIKNGEEISDVEIVAENLELPWELEILSSEDIFVTERSGDLLRIGEEESILIVLFIYIILGGIIGYLFDKFKNRN